MEKILRTIEKFIPKKLYRLGQPIYHYLLALTGALIYRFPSQKIFIIGITGTKGKTSVAELVNTVLEGAGYKTALAGTLRFKVGENSRPNKYKMTMPGRFFVQKFLHQAVDKKCDYAILEMTSEGTKQFRHKFINLNAMIFTNLAPEHIESHGSYEKYRTAKLKIFKALEKSNKKEKIAIVNKDDKEAPLFLNFNIPQKITYSLSEAQPFELKKDGSIFNYKNTLFRTSLNGEFNILNILSAIKFGETQNIDLETIRKAIENFKMIRGRVEKIEIDGNPPAGGFTVVVDYAHTPDSLEKLYQAFPERKICVLGNCGGGRDTWKRKVMGEIADKYCDQIILTNEDPYNEDPQKIIDEMSQGISNKPLEKILDRKEAITKAIQSAQKDDVILITGKGTDPYIMGPNNTKIEWDDASVVREILKNK